MWCGHGVASLALYAALAFCAPALPAELTPSVPESPAEIQAPSPAAPNEPSLELEASELSPAPQRGAESPALGTPEQIDHVPPAVFVPLVPQPSAQPQSQTAPVDPAPPLTPQATPTPEFTPEATQPILPPVEITVPEPAPPPKEAHVALLLPLKSNTYGRAAQTVREGFMAAANVHTLSDPLPVKIYECDEDAGNLVATYRMAIDEGARIVVGPMTRDAVGAIARSDSVSVPTLALNSPEIDAHLPALFYSLNLSLEAEARQLAHIAFAPGKKAVTVADNSTLSKRVENAFAAEWAELGGTIAKQTAFKPIPKRVSEFRAALKEQAAEVVFLALDAEAARKIRPYIPSAIPVYATSQIFRSKSADAANTDLQGVQFVDMPWLLKPDHAAVMVYPRPKQALSAELQRFYALGVDAFRISQLLLRSEGRALGALDGVSGRITLNSGHQFARELLSAEFTSDGSIKSISR